MSIPLRLVMLNESPSDAELVVDELRRAGFELDWKRVATRDEFLASLNPSLDLVLADYALSQYDGLVALRETLERGLDVPFIFVSDAIGEELAVSAISEGADGFVVRDRLAHLGHVVSQALEHRELRRKNRAAEAVLRRSEASLERAQVQVHLGSWEIDLATQTADWSREMFHIYGLDPAGAVPTMSEFFKLIFPGDGDLIVDASRRALEQDEPVEVEFRTTPVRGETRHLLATFGRVLDSEGQAVRLTGTVLDITERKKAEDRIRRLSRLYSTLSEVNQAIVRCTSEEDLFPRVCRAAVDHGGLAMAWIGLVDEASGRVRPVASYGQGVEYLEGIEITVDAGDPYGRGPTGTAIRGNQPSWVQDFQSDVALSPWHERASHVGFGASAALPLRRNGVPIGALNLYAGTVNAFDEEVQKLCVEMAGDISFALDNFVREAERKRAEDARAESEQILRLFVEHAPAAIAMFDRDMNYIVASRRYLVDYALGEQGIVGRSHYEVFPEMPERWKEVHRRCLAGATERAEEDPFPRADGTLDWVRWEIRPWYERTGNIGGIVLFSEVITERKRAEATLELEGAALNAAADAMVITGRDGSIEWINPAFTTLTGYTAEEALGKNPRELVKSGVHGQGFYKNMWDTILAGEVWQGEFTNRRKDGSLYPEEQTITPVKDGSGVISHFIAIKRDITERKRLEAELLHSQKMDSVGQLAGGIAHDFNNLLTVIAGTAFLISDQLAADDPVREDVQQITRAADRAAAMTRQLLAFSRKQILQSKLLDLGGLLLDMETMLGRLIGEDIGVVVVVPAEGAFTITADPGQIEQVIMNLAVNARDAMPAGGTLMIEIRAVEVDGAMKEKDLSLEPGRYVQLSMSDTGEGMDEATLQRIFEPFFTTKKVGRGTGLGLSTVFGIVSQSGGTIRVDSTVGMGTTFKIWFPRVENAVQADAPAFAAGSE